jgi:acetylornithine deacetylase/succinyl-diaminopimelate desuccinylase-like protein
MANAARRLGFETETFNGGLVRDELGIEDFDGVLGVNVNVCGPVHHAHAALPDNRVNAVPLIQHLADELIDGHQRLAVFDTEGERMIIRLAATGAGFFCC